MTELPDFWTSGLPEFWTSGLPYYSNTGMATAQPANSKQLLKHSQRAQFREIGKMKTVVIQNDIGTTIALHP